MLSARRIGPALVLPLALGCHADPSGASSEPLPGADRLAQSFPAHAGEILSGNGGFEVAPGGFEVPRPVRGLRAVIPARADAAVRLVTGDGFELSLLETGASGEASLAGSAASYARPGGVSFWKPTVEGYEEWLLLGPSRSDPVASWEVAGGSLTQAGGGAIEILDGAGLPRLRVAAPRAYTASGRPIGVRLGVRGARIELSLDGRADGEEVLVDPVWTPTGLMTVARWSHSATKLDDGRVLVAGGVSAGAWDTAELYDPAVGTWTRTLEPMPHPHHHHVAALLCDGRVLVACGISDDSSISHQAEIYDPTTDTWAVVESSWYGHTYGTATTLDDCSVLVVGGYDARWETEIYDPTTNRWTVVATQLSQTRFYHTATRLPDGRVVVPGGGFDENGIWYSLTNTDVYTPATGAWSQLASLDHARRSHATVLMPDGTLLATGGSNGGVDDGTQATVELDTTETYDPVKDAWSPGPTLESPRTAHTATLLPNGAVIIAGGVDDTGSSLSSTETYLSGKVYPSAPMNRDRYTHTATLLDDGAVLIAGGLYQATTELYTVGANGAACADDGECSSGFCAAGTCCDTACNDGCSSCQAPGALGTCTALCADATHARACAAPSGVCGSVASCGIIICSPFLCTTAARGCASTCDTNHDCAPGFACDAGHQCVAPPSQVDGDPGTCHLGRSPGATGAAGGLGALLAVALAALRRRERRRLPARRP
jgi:N-acetylneuraminic acid mutarotase